MRRGFRNTPFTGNQLQFSLSYYANEIMSQDISTFGLNSDNATAEYLNTVFAVYHYEAEASYEIAERLFYNKLYYAFKNTRTELSTKTEEEMARLATIRKYSMMQDKIEYEKKFRKRIYVRTEIRNYLLGLSSDENGTFCEEGDNYKSVSDYFKAVIEEFCRRPYYEREQFYFAQHFRSIENAMNNNHAVEIKTKNGSSFRVRVFKIDTDPQSLYHYVVGYSVPTDKPNLTPWKQSFRISRIEKIKEIKSVRNFIKTTDQKNLIEAIQEKGIQFVGSTINEIIVRLTDDGIRKYNQQVHLRPTVSKIINKHDFVFRTTETQIEYYFLKFGPDAEILHPESLRNKFRETYLSAYNKYI